MNRELLQTVQSAQQELDPQFRALRAATSVLNQAMRQAGEEKTDALAMQKVLAKLQQAAAQVENASLQRATAAFGEQTQQALDGLAFDFARDLKESFEQRGQSVQGRPPTLVVDALVLQIDIAARKAHWFYGKDPLTHPIALSINTILKAYDTQRKAIMERNTPVEPFLVELWTAWQELLAARTRQLSGKRFNLIEIYSKVVLNRQSARFWNTPSRQTFKDYLRVHFVRDLVLAQAAPSLEREGRTFALRLAVATKSQADNPSRSLWLPQSALEGEYYAELTFEES